MIGMAENEQKEVVRAEASAISRAFGRILGLFGWRLLFGLALSAGALMLLLWLTGEVFEGDTAAFDDHLRTVVHGYSSPPLTSAMRAVSVLGSTVFLVSLGALVAVFFAFFRLRRFS